jgi:hypothetical protein
MAVKFTHSILWWAWTSTTTAPPSTSKIGGSATGTNSTFTKIGRCFRYRPSTRRCPLIVTAVKSSIFWKSTSSFTNDWPCRRSSSPGCCPTPPTRHRSPSGLAGSNLQVPRMGENITDARKKGNYPLRFEIQSLVDRRFHRTWTVGIVWPRNCVVQRQSFAYWITINFDKNQIKKYWI